jgi:lysophospholipase L1-like esterase
VRWAGILALAGTSLALALGLAELATRIWVGPVAPRNFTPVPAEIRAPAPGPDLPYLLRPGAEVVHPFGSDPRGYFDPGARLSYRINALGWRSSPLERQKPPGRFRIVALGDSITFGTGVREEDLFATRLGAALEAEAPGRYEIWNLGIMGYNTAQEVALLQRFGVDLEPDLVLLVYTLNDAETQLPPDFLAALGLESPRGPRRKASPSLLYEHLRERWENRKVRQRTIRLTRASYRDDSPGWLQVQDALRQAAALARRHDFALTVVIFPILWQLDAEYPFAEAHARVAAAASGLGLPVLDLLDAFRGRDGEALWVHPSNQHPNEEGHAIAADALLRFLEGQGLLGG